PRLKAIVGDAPIIAAPYHTETAVLVNDLVKRFRNGAAVIDGLQLTVGAGSRVAIIGANGTGKSTLVRMLVRLVEPDEGRISIFHNDVRQMDARKLRALRASVGFVFQRHNLVARLSALSNVIHGAQGRVGGPRTWIQALAPRHLREEAMGCLERVGLADKALARVDTLSGGQSQRVAVARMLMQRPALVIADEPDASLDPKSGAEVMAMLAELAGERKATLIFVSHRMEHARQFSERIVGLAGGRVAFDRRSRGVSDVELSDFFQSDVAA
ncbi:MAG: phosphonate ABC transporter ATP-binding protein, partial [Beijerinckiaceae bacterium]